jgi:hypothetical protein
LLNTNNFQNIKSTIFNIATSNVIVMFIVIWCYKWLKVVFAEYKPNSHAVYHVVLFLFSYVFVVDFSKRYFEFDFNTLHVKYSYK